MRRSAAGEYRWALTLFPTHAYAAEADMSLSRLRGLLLPRLPGHRPRPGHRLAAPVRHGRAGSPTGSRARRRSTSRRPGTDIKLDVAGRTWIPCVGRPQHARRRVLHRPGRGLGGGRGQLLASRRSTAAARCRACSSASRTARSWTPPPSAARTSCIEMLDTDDGARRLGELGIGTNYGITDRHQGDPARREDRRHACTWRSA